MGAVDNPPIIHRKFVLEDPAEKLGLSIHVLGIFSCPDWVDASKVSIDSLLTTTKEDSALKHLQLMRANGQLDAATAAHLDAAFKIRAEDNSGTGPMTQEQCKTMASIPPPLLSVRYQLNGRADPQFELKIQLMERATHDGVLDATAAGGLVKVKAESIAEVMAAFEMLEENRHRLASSYVAKFEGMSPNHNPSSPASYRPSFLVPPPDVAGKKLPAALEVCASPSCEKRRTQGAAKFKVCSACRSASYCCAECQKAHWKKHKGTCKKSGKSSASVSADADRSSPSLPLKSRESKKGTIGDTDANRTRPSLLLPLDRCPDGLPELEGMFVGLVSYTGVDTSKKSNKVGRAPRNIHGDNTFVVKVQVPLDPIGGADGWGGFRCLVYDESRSFTAYFASGLTAESKEVVRMVQQYGVLKFNKAYFFAIREGPNVRIFYDRVAPVPAW
jgi:hypothetical protein